MDGVLIGLPGEGGAGQDVERCSERQSAGSIEFRYGAGAVPTSVRSAFGWPENAMGAGGTRVHGRVTVTRRVPSERRRFRWCHSSADSIAPVGG